MGPILDILYPRHSIMNNEKFALIKDKLTFIVDKRFGILDKYGIEYLKKLKTLQNISNRLIINLKIKDGYFRIFYLRKLI
jgi:hypothetical protein